MLITAQNLKSHKLGLAWENRKKINQIPMIIFTHCSPSYLFYGGGEY
jgi:hypothetical protein